MTRISGQVNATLLACVVLLFILVNFFAQDPQSLPAPSPSPSASVSPSPSPSSSPVRTPSPTPLPGAQNFHQWGSITVFNGLPSDSVRAIAQTPDGVMWFGTDNGLARFDGRRIQNFSLAVGDSDRILALETDASGNLWIGTGAGAFVYWYLLDRFDPVAGTGDIGVTTLLVSGEVVNLGTNTGMVLAVGGDIGNVSATPMFSEPLIATDGAPLSISGLIRHENALIASTSGRGVFFVKEGEAIEFPLRLRSTVVNALLPALPGDRTFWLGTDAARNVSGLSVYNGHNPPLQVAAPTSKVLSLETNETGIWAGTERFGLFHFVSSKVKKNYTFENTSGGLRSNTVFTLFTDREGVLWIGTNRGVSRFDSQGASQEAVSEIPNSNFIRTLFFANKDYILAGSNRGLFIFNGKVWKSVAAFEGKLIYAIADYRGDTVVGTSTGIFELTGTQLTPNETRGFAEFRNLAYAAVPGRGIFRLPPGHRGHGVYDPRDDSPTQIYSGSATAAAGGIDRLWIGTDTGALSSYDGANVREEATAEAFRFGAIRKLFVSQDHTLWIAAQHGVFRFRDGQVEKIIDAEDVRDLLVDGNDVWAPTTTQGLLHARNDQQFGWIVSPFGFEQGLPSEKAFGIVRSDKGFLIATNRGVVTYRPGMIEPKLIPTRLLSQRVHDLREIASRIPLEYPQNTLLVEVAGQSSRTFPEEFQYGFVLRNGKGEILDRRVSNDAQYAPAGLAPGEYEIEATAFNRDLLASAPLTIRLSVGKAPFPWTATALAVLLLLALVGLIWAIIEHRRIAHRNRELAAARLDLANEAERERRRIARDLHDQTLADLRKLMITSDKLVGDNTEFRSEIEAVSTEIRRICEDLSPSVLENVGLVAALEFLLDQTVENRRFSADESLEERINFPINVQLQIYRIAQEVLTNIVRHSSATEVEMHVEASPSGKFSLSVRDNGGSFQPDAATQKGRGISNIRARANLINAEVGWKESGVGNVFSLKIDA